MSEERAARAEPEGAERTGRWPAHRARKFRQAAFVYLHVGLLYEFGVLALWRVGMLPTERGPVAVWLAFGAVIVLLVLWGLLSWQNVWFVRIVWGLHALRLPALIGGAFLPTPAGMLPESFYQFALVVVLINLWMLARAGWDL